MTFHSACLALSKALSATLPFILYLLSLGMGCHVTVSDIGKAYRNGPALCIYAFAYYVLTPGLWLLVLRALQVPREYATAFLFVSNSPGGLFGNVLTLWSKGDVGLSVGLTIFGLLLSLVSWGPIAHLWLSAFDAKSFSIPMKVFMGQCAACVVPVFAGMLCRRYRPQWAHMLRRIVGFFVGLTIISFLVTFLTVKLHVLTDLPWRVWLMGLLGPPCMFVVYAFARFCPVYRDGGLARGVKHEHALAITFEFVVKNVGLVLVVAVVAFPEAEADRFVAVITSLSVGLHVMYIVAWALGRMAERQAAEACLACADGSPLSPPPPARRRSLVFGFFAAQEPETPTATNSTTANAAAALSLVRTEDANDGSGA